MDELTSEELETLHLIADGLTDDQIAGTLYRSVAAIKNRGERIRAKLGATTRAHAVALGYQRGILLADPDAHVMDAHALVAALHQAGYRLARHDMTEPASVLIDRGGSRWYLLPSGRYCFSHVEDRDDERGGNCDGASREYIEEMYGPVCEHWD